MRKLVVLGVTLVLVAPLFLQAQATGQNPFGPARGGALGPVDALGQQTRRPPTQSGPAPRLPDGTIDLTGVWVGGGPVADIAVGLPKGETLPLLPASVKLMEYRAQHESDDPHLW